MFLEVKQIFCAERALRPSPEDRRLWAGSALSPFSRISSPSHAFLSAARSWRSKPRASPRPSPPPPSSRAGPLPRSPPSPSVAGSPSSASSPARRAGTDASSPSPRLSSASAGASPPPRPGLRTPRLMGMRNSARFVDSSRGLTLLLTPTSSPHRTPTRSGRPLPSPQDSQLGL